ncbi:ergothioneine biosynthesis protein EgtC [Streptomonospora litoralis]|uniref:Gamma-glutamyl-hercynylcysteine sulfoxide hydrolase n=1 Tax=Streptomonospora litoralis TaxID=2498135 RepID=A0A4V0ZJE9_9ACTN|nr:ergothioneine biosynthesis protein EgtC [Streptomonospora litoralis]QBI53242.1 Amidohydrolase EgtC [Streptomonospora litoralis]
MCRHLAYLGPPRTLYDLLYADTHSLHTQSYAPREQRHGTVNADGFGAGWYTAERPEPLRYRRAMPIWADSSFADVAQAVTAACAVAAVRDATPGFGSDESCAQPFRGDGRLFSHNGAAKDDEALSARLGAPAPPGALDARTPVDSAPLFAAALRLWRAGAGLGEALARVVVEARACSPGRYNLLAADGIRLAATADGDTLYARHGAQGVWLASEPLDDDPAWQRVPDGSLAIADARGLHISPIDAAA